MELFKDDNFQYGFWLSPVNSAEQYSYADIINFNDVKERPAWKLAQWFSNFPLQGAEVKTEDGYHLIENEGKRVALSISDEAALTLEMMGTREYEKGPRKDGQPWPHLLIEQGLDQISIKNIEKLVLSFDGTIEKCENHMSDDYNPSLHSAHVVFYFIIKNTNKDSKDYQDFFWFGVPFYDYRYDFFPEYLAIDGGKEDATQKMIYTVGADKMYKDKVEIGKVYKFNVDILPYIKEGLIKGQKEGFLLDTTIEDLSITGFNVGWELFGTFDVSFTLSKPSLKAYY